jgi:hypothetical protein
MTIMTNMASLDHNVQRRAHFPNGPTSHPIQNNGYMGPQPQNNGYPASHAQSLRVSPYLGAANGMMQHGPDSMAGLAHGFGAMGLHHSPNRSSLQVAPAAMNDYSNGAMHSQGGYYVQPPMNYMGANMVHNSPVPQANGMHQAGHYMQQPGQSLYLSQMSLESAHVAQAMVPYHPANQWGSRVPSGASHAMPTLVGTRRGSLSSNEEQIPSTPYHPYGYNDLAIIERSPPGVFSSSTPSPASYSQVQYPVANKNFNNQVPMQFQLLLKQDPAIPRAIPAPSSPAKPLDRCLENKNGETNVYIRGLLPETTDEMLHAWGGRFGDIASSKSIIDHKNGLCKGFGFIKYHNFDDAESCIRGFHFLGYEVSFARVRPLPSCA